jgi:hypothetical protein
MQKNFTPLKNTKLQEVDMKNLQPKKETLKKILQFAATYRVEVMHNSLKIGVFLN